MKAMAQPCVQSVELTLSLVLHLVRKSTLNFSVQCTRNGFSRYQPVTRQSRTSASLGSRLASGGGQFLSFDT